MMKTGPFSNFFIAYIKKIQYISKINISFFTLVIDILIEIEKEKVVTVDLLWIYPPLPHQ